MAKLNFKITPKFKKDLEEYMRQRGIYKKSEAIRIALHELVNLLDVSKTSDFESWLGAGLKTELKSNEKLKSEDDLWKIG
jgi:hypothetical protein